MADVLNLAFPYFSLIFIGFAGRDYDADGLRRRRHSMFS